MQPQCHTTIKPLAWRAQQIRAQNPGYTDALLLLAAAHYQLGNYNESVAFNAECLALDPHIPEAQANLANALQQQGHIDASLMYYQVCAWQGFLKGGKEGCQSWVQFAP
jgi:tetratricopeptide (TPR) repeat protein